jgi:hypothetical protein
MKRKQKDLSKDSQLFLQNLSQIDLKPLVWSLLCSDPGKNWDTQRMMRAIAYYLAFLFLIHLYPEKELTPPPEVDTVWHTHILNTQKYREDCQTLFGYFVDHCPTPERTIKVVATGACIKPAGDPT